MSAPSSAAASAPSQWRRLFRAIPLWRVVVVALVPPLTWGLCAALQVPIGMTRSGVVMDLPFHMGDWWGNESKMSESERFYLPPDTQLTRKVYDSGQGDQVTCCIVLSGADKRSIHRAEICLRGQGWTIQGSQLLRVPLHSGREIPVMALRLVRPVELSNGAHAEVGSWYLYWFVGNGAVTASHWDRIWLASWDRVVHHVNHRWAYVMVTSLITDNIQAGGKDGAQTLAMLEKFIADIVPHVQKDEGAVEAVQAGT